MALPMGNGCANAIRLFLERPGSSGTLRRRSPGPPPSWIPPPPISKRKLRRFDAGILRMRNGLQHDSMTKNLDFHKRYNDLVESIGDEARRQGISCMIAKWGFRSLPSLIVTGVEPNGNRVAKMYLEMLRDQGVQGFKFSIPKSGEMGFETTSNGGLAIVEAAFLDMLQGKENFGALHDIRYRTLQIFKEKGERTVYAHGVEAGGGGEPGPWRIGETWGNFREGVPRSDLRAGPRAGGFLFRGEIQARGREGSALGIGRSLGIRGRAFLPDLPHGEAG